MNDDHVYIMNEKKDDTTNSEFDEEFTKLIKEGVENLGILDNESVREFLESKKIYNAPSIPLFNEDRYKENRPKPITYYIYPGKLFRKDDAT